MMNTMMPSKDVNQHFEDLLNCTVKVLDSQLF